jgi:putative transposase
MHKAIKVRLYPTGEQEVLLAKAFGTTRWLWNYLLGLNNKTYLETGKGISGMDLKKLIPSLKTEHEWLKETYSQCLQQASLNLSRAFVNFFEKRAGFPKFKSKFGQQSLQYPQNVKILENALYFPKLGEIKSVWHRTSEGELKTVTISKTTTGQYYASLLFEIEGENPVPSADGKAVGIDLGLTHFAITSDGLKVDNPRHIKKHEKNLKRKQRKLARKTKGSKSRDKARKLVAKVHQKISNARQDFLHKLSRKLINENQVITVETLNIKGMVRNHKLAKTISDVGWGMFINFLDYKARMDGKTFIEVDRFFPSSKTCHVCLTIVDSLPLDIRSWTCGHCHTEHDRDVNAAINLRDEGLRIISSGRGETADGGNVRPKRGRKSSIGRLPLRSEARSS